MKSSMVLLTNINGESIAGWKAGEFPDWLATYLNTLPNENNSAPYRLQNGSNFYHVPTCVPLAIGVYELLCALPPSNEGQEAAAAGTVNTAAAPLVAYCERHETYHVGACEDYDRAVLLNTLDGWKVTEIQEAVHLQHRCGFEECVMTESLANLITQYVFPHRCAP